MITLFSKQCGKISAGSGITESGRKKSSLALRPFTLGKYSLYKNAESFNIRSAETVKSYFRIGENVDKYMYASYILELTGKLLPENEANPGIFNLLTDFLEIIEKRNKEFATPVAAYEIKLLKYIGLRPELEKCANCGSEIKTEIKKEIDKETDRSKNNDQGKVFFGIENGGVLCRDCAKTLKHNDNRLLIYKMNFDIVNILKYFMANPIKTVEKLALSEDRQKVISGLIRTYMKYHMDLGELKSESFLV